jgi:hypothetical protein
MAAPSRFTSGLTQAASFQPLGQVGIPDPFFYAYYEDDFFPYNAALYTVTAPNSGTVAQNDANGIGGRIVFTTGATAGNFAEIQTPTAALQYTAGKKLAYLARVQLAAASTSSFVAGLIETNATPFTSIANGFYFFKAAGSATLQFIIKNTTTTIGTLANIGTITALADIDLGFYMDRLGNTRIFVGSNLEGVKRQNVATLGPNYGILASALTGSITASQLNPTLAISNGSTAAATSMVADFQFAGMER